MKKIINWIVTKFRRPKKTDETPVDRIITAAIRFKWYTDEEEAARGNIYGPCHFIIICGLDHGDCYDKFLKLIGSFSEYAKKNEWRRKNRRRILH